VAEHAGQGRELVSEGSKTHSGKGLPARRKTYKPAKGETYLKGREAKTLIAGRATAEIVTVNKCMADRTSRGRRHTAPLPQKLRKKKKAISIGKAGQQPAAPQRAVSDVMLGKG